MIVSTKDIVTTKLSRRETMTTMQSSYEVAVGDEVIYNSPYGAKHGVIVRIDNELGPKFISSDFSTIMYLTPNSFVKTGKQIDLKHNNEKVPMRTNNTVSFNFIGTFDASHSYCEGDIVAVDNEPFVYSNQQWFPLGQAKNFAPNDADKQPATCKCCGAPLVIHSGMLKCEYCGTMYA